MTLARIGAGAIGGAIATVPMSAHMLGVPSERRIGVPPPRRLVGALLPDLPEEEQAIAATLVHVAIGTGAGAAFGLLTRDGGMVRGALFGVAVWVVGYEVLMPLVGALRPAHRDARGRVAALLQAHLIYGAALGAISRK